MSIDATFWVAVSFIIFCIVIVYLKVPQKINSSLNNMIKGIGDEIKDAEKLKEDAKNLLNEGQEKLESAHKESKQIIKNAKDESEKLIIDTNNEFFKLLK